MGEAGALLLRTGHQLMCVRPPPGTETGPDSGGPRGENPLRPTAGSSWDPHFHAHAPSHALPGMASTSPAAPRAGEEARWQAPAGVSILVTLPLSTTVPRHLHRFASNSPNPLSLLPRDPCQLQRMALQPPPCFPLLAPTASTEKRSPPARPSVQQPHAQHRPARVLGASGVEGGSRWDL